MDGSPTGIGAIPTQTNGSKTNVVAYASKTLKNVVSRYSQTEREALAIIWSSEYFRLYLIAKKILCGRITNPSSRSLKQTYIPSSLAEKLVDIAHEETLGIVKTKQPAASRYKCLRYLQKRGSI